MNSEIDEHYPCFGCFMKADPPVSCSIEDNKLQDECPCGKCLVKGVCKLNLCDIFGEFADKHFPRDDAIDRRKLFKMVQTYKINTKAWSPPDTNEE